jgi:hypothetical protein
MSHLIHAIYPITAAFLLSCVAPAVAFGQGFPSPPIPKLTQPLKEPFPDFLVMFTVVRRPGNSENPPGSCSVTLFEGMLYFAYHEKGAEFEYCADCAQSDIVPLFGHLYQFAHFGGPEEFEHDGRIFAVTMKRVTDKEILKECDIDPKSVVVVVNKDVRFDSTIDKAQMDFIEVKNIARKADGKKELTATIKTDYFLRQDRPGITTGDIETRTVKVGDVVKDKERVFTVKNIVAPDPKRHLVGWRRTNLERRWRASKFSVAARREALGSGPVPVAEWRNGSPTDSNPDAQNAKRRLELAVPQTRGAKFYPPVLERRKSSERAAWPWPKRMCWRLLSWHDVAPLPAPSARSRPNKKTPARARLVTRTGGQLGSRSKRAAGG